MSTPAPDDPPSQPASAVQGWVTSLLFWLCLLLSATMFASVALAPKLLAWLTLKHEHYTHQVRLVEMERKVTYLGRVVDAMENDPEFASQLARVDFDAVRPGDERIAVDSTLSLDGRERQPEVPAVPRTTSLLTPLLHQITDRPELRRALLTIAAVLILFAFTFLQESAVETLAPVEVEKPAAPRTSLAELLAQRYRRTPPDA